MMGMEVAAMLVIAAIAGAETSAAEPTVVFVCEHGSAKSLIAAEWFNRLAREKKLGLRATSRGVTPDASVPPWVVQELGKDGFQVGGFVPRPLVKEDVGRAARVVAIGADSPLLAEAGAAVERWDDIPPASTSYAASRDRMRERIRALLAALAARPSPAP